MFLTGAYVMYGSQGVCRIEEIRRQDLSGSEREYYILKPLDDPKMVIYVPTDAESLVAQMRPLLSEEQLTGLLRRGAGEDGVLEWVADPRSRSEQFRQILQSGDRARLFAMLRAIYRQRERLSAGGRKLYAADESACQKGERLLHGEIAAILQIHPSEVQQYIHSLLAQEG